MTEEKTKEQENGAVSAIGVDSRAEPRRGPEAGRLHLANAGPNGGKRSGQLQEIHQQTSERRQGVLRATGTGNGGGDALVQEEWERRQTSVYQLFFLVARAAARGSERSYSDDW